MTGDILEPPGSIVIIGGGLLGLEAALYGRFLGYEVQVLEALDIGQRWLAEGDNALRFLPGRGISALALDAIAAQDENRPELQSLPLHAQDWAHQIMRPLAEVDLLAGRVHAHHRVSEVRQVPNEEDASELDFQIRCAANDTVWEAEAVIDTAGWAVNADCTDTDWSATPYFFCLTGIDANTEDEDNPEDEDNWESRSRRGRDQIRQLFASLGERPTLDLYRPRRL